MASDNELIDLIYAALLGEQPWQLFLASLAREIPNGSALFFAQGFGARPEFAALHCGLPEGCLGAYESHFAAINPWIPGTEATAPGRGVVGHRICAQDLVRRSEYYNDFLRPIGIETSSGLVIERRPDVQFNLTILSGEDSPEATTRQAAQFERLAPHLRRAAKFYQSDGGLKMASELGASLLESVDLGVLIIGTGPRLQLASATAQRIAAETDVFRVNPIGHIRLSDVEAQTGVGLMLRRTYDGPKVRRLSGGQLSLTLLRIERDGLSQLLQGPSVVVIVERDPGRRIAPRPEDLRRRYGLTNAEGRVLQGLLRGKSLGEIAQEAGRSLETLRSQQKALFRKLDVQSQFQLVTRIYGSRRIDPG
jgi:DNA-binding CsgD family transcriptional regulator